MHKKKQSKKVKEETHKEESDKKETHEEVEDKENIQTASSTSSED